MLQSELFTKTKKEFAKDEEAINDPVDLVPFSKLCVYIWYRATVLITIYCGLSFKIGLFQQGH